MLNGWLKCLAATRIKQAGSSYWHLFDKQRYVAEKVMPPAWVKPSDAGSVRAG
jgi:hypothetical protein